MEGHFALTRRLLSQKVLTRSRDKQNKPILIIQGNSFFISFTSENNRFLQGVCVGKLWVDVGEHVCTSERNRERRGK